ncbi:MAG: acyl-CoA dehydrogenase family protein [Deltaproteobacteria bacterium]|nr:acyl-CoA dehydrogenase family protein [Deltaproteobacteria bacterium]
MFQLNEQQQMIQDMFRDYMAKEIQPKVEAMEDGTISSLELSRKLYSVIGAAEMIRPSLEKLAKKREANPEERIEMANVVSDSAGAMGGDPMIMMILLKEISRVSPGMAMSFGVSVGLAGMAVLSKGTVRQIREYAIPLMTFEKIGSWCLTEPGAGSDAFGSMKTKAIPDGKGGYIINGTKTFITNAPEADLFIVYAKLDTGQPPEERPVHAFILERGMPGLTTGKPFHKLGMRDSPTSEVFMDTVRLEKKHLIGENEQKTGGRTSTKDSLGNERSGVPPICLGIIERCYEESIKYAKERVQFGRPIGEFQAVQLKIAHMYMLYKNVENIVFRTAWMQANGIRDASFINASKAYASTSAVEVTNIALQIYGGYGYMQEYPIEKLYRDAKLMELGAGTTDINLLTSARIELDLF